MRSKEEVTASPDDTRDELKVIKGIGPTFSRALHTAGIHHVDDLTRFTPEELSTALLERAGVKVAPEKIEANDWIGQARELAQPASVACASAGRVAEPLKPLEVAPAAPKWRQHAGISLFFDRATDNRGETIEQTRVYHEESGDETHFPGFETTPWVDWILRHAGLPAVRASACVEILDVDLTEIESPMRDSPRTFAATIRFRLSGPDAAALQTSGIPYQVQVQALSRDRNTLELLANHHDRLRPEVDEYVCDLEAPMPDLGDYELHSLVLLLPPDRLVTCHRSSIVHVVV